VYILESHFCYLSLASEKCGMKKTVGRYFSIKIYISNNEERYRESLRSYVLEKLKFNLQAKMLLFDKDSLFFSV